MGKSFWVNIFRFWVGLLLTVVISGAAMAQDEQEPPQDDVENSQDDLENSQDSAGGGQDSHETLSQGDYLKRQNASERLTALVKKEVIRLPSRQGISIENALVFHLGEKIMMLG